MIGYVITTHFDNYQKIYNALDSIGKFSTKNKYLIVFDNEGLKGKKEKLLNEFKFINEYHHVEDQSKGGLTYTWNKGIDICLKNNCEGVILLNHDIKCNNTLHFLEEAFLDKSNVGIYSCTTNKAPWKNHLNQESYIESYEKPIIEKFYNKQGPGGFCLALSKEVLEKNKFDSKHYFNPHYRFGGNERYYNNSWYNKKGCCYIVRNCFIEHNRDHDWIKLSYCYEEDEKLKIKKQKKEK